MPTPRSVRSSSLACPLLTSPRVLCTLSRALSWRGALRLSLWRAALRHTASLKIQLCQGHCRAVAARAGARCRLALARGVGRQYDGRIGHRMCRPRAVILALL